MRRFVLLLLVSCVSGCSSDLSAKFDLFWWKKNEPRTLMPWYASAGGDSANKRWNREDADGFVSLGDE